MKQKNRNVTYRVQSRLILLCLAASTALVESVDASQSTNQMSVKLTELEQRFQDDCINISLITELRVLLDADERLARTQACKKNKWEAEVIDVLDKNYIENLEGDVNFRDQVQTKTLFIQRVIRKKQTEGLTKAPSTTIGGSPTDNNGAGPKLDSLDNYTTVGN